MKSPSITRSDKPEARRFRGDTGGLLWCEGIPGQAAGRRVVDCSGVDDLEQPSAAARPVRIAVRVESASRTAIPKPQGSAIWLLALRVRVQGASR